ncbi:MAG: AAA family ATPase [Thermoplasmatales archaeon]|nr:MAG: AAA family ATPase [Thermoplasmatales archaeon]
MIIENVKMENFLSHSHSDVNLGTGINIILGQNGSGKSSIFEAIKVAFFGQGESERKRVVSYNSTMANIQVRFRIGTHEYEVYRQIENKKDRETTRSAALLMDGQKLAEGASAVSNEIQNIMGISKSAFINSIYVDQGQIDSLVKESPAERKDVFNEIIGLKNYDKAFSEVDRIVKGMSERIGQYEYLTDDLKKTNDEKARKEEELKNVILEENKNRLDMDQTERLKDNINEKHRKFIEKDAKLQSQIESTEKAKKEMDELERKIVDLREGLKNLDSLKRKQIELENSDLYLNGDKITLIEQSLRQIEDEKNQINQLEKELESLMESAKEINSLNKRYSELNSKIKEIEEKEKEREQTSEGNYKYINLEKEVGKKLSEVEKSKKMLKEIEKSLPERIVSQKMSFDDVEDEIKKLRTEESEKASEIATCSTVIKRLTDEITKLKAKIDELENERQCPLCGQELTQEHRSRVMEEYRSQIESSDEEINSNENKQEALGKRIEILKVSIEALSSNYVRNYFKINEEIDRKEKEINSMQNDLNGTRDAHIKYEQILSFLKDSEKIKREFQELNNKLSGLRGTVESLNKQDIPEKINARRKKIDEIETVIKSNQKSYSLWQQGKRSQDFDKLKKAIMELKVEIESYLGQEDSLKDAKTRQDSLRVLIENANTEIGKLKEEINQFGDIERELSDINSRYSDLVERRVNLTGQKSSLNTSIQDLEKNIEKFKGDLEEIERTKKLHDFLVLVRKAFNRDGIPQLIRQMALESINSITRNLISRFNLNMEDIRISDDLDVDIMQYGEVKNITQLSGGEKTAVSIAMRLAIAKYLGRNISTIMMDEPTIYLDEERRNDLREILQYAMKDLSDEGIFPQIVIITHHTELETAADISLHVSKVDGRSVVENSSY